MKFGWFECDGDDIQLLTGRKLRDSRLFPGSTIMISDGEQHIVENQKLFEVVDLEIVEYDEWLDRLENAESIVDGVATLDRQFH